MMKQLSDFQFILGQTVRFELIFKTFTGQLANPNSFVFKIKMPDDTIDELTDADFTHVSTGVYEYFYEIVQERRHFVRIESEGIPKSADEYSFDVAESAF